MLLSAAEVTSIWALPNEDIGTRVERVMARWLPVPAKAFTDPGDPRNLVLGLGEKSDGTWAPIGIPYADLRYVLHITAPMGRGKSEWLKNMFLGLLRSGAGFLALDCKGTDLVNGTLPLIPLDRERDVTILDINGVMLDGMLHRPAMNLLSPAFGRSLGIDSDTQASTLMNFFSVLDSRFNDAPAMRQFANYGLLALLEGEPQATLMHLIRFFGDEDYRTELLNATEPGSEIPRIKNPTVRDFWDRRFPEMSNTETSPLKSFERRIDQLLAYPSLAGMLVAPGCSIDLRRMMDSRGILLAGISAKDGPIAAIAGTLLLTQMTLAALSRTNVPEAQRPDWPVVIDEAQIVFGQNPGMAPVIFSQLRAMRIGTVVVHQNLDQLANIMDVLAGNAQNRIILGSEVLDAGTYGSNYRALGLTPQDFMNMERFDHQYTRLYGCGDLFSCRMLPLAKPIEEPAPPVVAVDWRTIRAPARSDEEAAMDEQLAHFRELAVFDKDEAIKRLGALPDDAFALYCARTAAHRAAQRQFILDNPGCIPLPWWLPPEEARLKQKETRIRTLSTLGGYIPEIETQALLWKLLTQTQQAAAARKEREEEEKGSRRWGTKRARPTAGAAAGNADRPAQRLAVGLSTVPTNENGQPLPSIDELLQRRGRRRREADSRTYLDEA